MSATPQHPFGEFPKSSPTHHMGAGQPPQQPTPSAALHWDGRQWVQVPIDPAAGGLWQYRPPAPGGLEHSGWTVHPHAQPQGGGHAPGSVVDGDFSLPPGVHLQPAAAPGLPPHAQVMHGAVAPETVATSMAAPVPAPVAVPMTPPVRDASRSTLAAVIVFVAAVVALWALLGYMHDMSTVLASVNNSNDKLVANMHKANEGLDQLEGKTAQIKDLNEYTERLAGLMGGIDTDMGGMLASVEGLGTTMGEMNGSLKTLDGELASVSTAEAGMTVTLGKINGGLGSQAENVKKMRKDLQSTSSIIRELPAMMRTTNERLAFTNKILCHMGKTGLATKLKLTIQFMGIPTGNATINAQMIPPGGWTC